MARLVDDDLNPTLLKGIRAIELVQMQKLYAFQNHGSKRYFERFGERLHDQFLGGSVADKLRFLFYIPFSMLQRARFRLDRAPASAEQRRRGVSRPLPRPENGAFHVAISIMGSLGDFMHHVPLMAAFHARFAPVEVDFFVHRLKLDDRSKLAVSGLPFVRQIVDISHLPELIAAGSYDLHIEIKHIVKYHVLNLPKALQDKPGLLELVKEADKRFEPYRFIFDSHPVFDGLLGRLMAERGMNAVDASGYFGNLPVTRDTPIPFAPPVADEVLRRHGLHDRAYITIHDGFEVDHAIAATSLRATRSWPLESWQRFVTAFKARCPDVLVVQIGTSKTAGAIANVDVSLVDKATLPEACWVIKQARLHVDTEAGLVRVASATQTPSISIQGPSATEFFHFAHSQPVQSPFCRGCYWVEFDWMTRCLRGFSRAECMYAIEPAAVAHLAAKTVEENASGAGPVDRAAGGSMPLPAIVGSLDPVG